MRMTTYGTLLTFGLLFVIGNGSTKTSLRPEDGHVVVGDIIFTNEQMAALKGDHSDYGDYNAVMDVFKHWSDGIIYYDMRYMQFREAWTGPRVQVIQSGGGCWSYVGKEAKDTSPQELSLDDECLEEGIIQHEFLHAAGIGHTQNRPDRDQYVIIHKGNIVSCEKNNFEKYSETAFSYHGLPYDFDSVMHYGGEYFGKPNGWWGKKITIQT